MVLEVATISLIVSVIALIANIFFNSKGSKKSDNKDLEERVKQDTKVDMKLDEIFRVSSETRNSIDSLRSDIQTHALKLTEIEASVKSAHKRIDSINKVVGSNENE